MSDFITTTDPIIGWEAIQPTHPIIERNPWDARIERAWQRRQEDIDWAYYAGVLEPWICDAWQDAIDNYLCYMQDVWTVVNEDCQTGRPDCDCETCQASRRLAYKY